MHPKELKLFLKSLPIDAKILNFGSYDDSLEQLARECDLNIRIDSCDTKPPTNAHEHFILLDPASPILPMNSCYYDAVVISHVIEHLPSPIESMAEWLRILKKNGLLYIEAPSDRSLLCKSNPAYLKHGFFSFWDDPTHRRPWPPAALYRLAYGYGCTMLKAGYIGTFYDKLTFPFIWLICTLTGDHHMLTRAFWRANKFSSYAIIQKPADYSEKREFTYVTFRKHA